MTDPNKAIEYVQHHIEKEIRALFAEKQEYRERGSDPEKVEDSFVTKWVAERQELEGSISETLDAEIRIALSGRAIALNWLLQNEVNVDGRPEWSPEIEFFSAFIDYETTYERIQGEFEQD